MEPLVWKVQLNFDDAIKQADAAIKDLSARASKVSTGGGGAAAIAEKEAAKQAAASEKVAIAAEKAAAREAAAWEKAAKQASAAAEKAASQAEAAIDREVTAQLKAAEKAIAADERAASQAIAAAKRQAAAVAAAITAEQKAAEKLAAALDKTVIAGDKAQRQLKLLSATTPAEKAAAAYEIEAAKIRGLAGAAGDAQGGTDALAAAQKRIAEALGGGEAAAGAAAEATEELGKANWQAVQGGMSLRKNLGDIANSMIAGMDPMQVLIQQGPQLADALTQGGSAADVATAAFGPMAGMIVGMGPALGVAALGAATFGTALLVLANAADTAATEAEDANRAIYEQGVYAEDAGTGIDALTRSWETFVGAINGAQTDVAVANGMLEEWEVNAGKAARAVRDGAAAQINAQAANISSLKAQQAAVQALIDTDATAASELPTLFARRKAIATQLAAAIPALEETRTLTDDTTAAVLAAAAADEEARRKKEALAKARKGNDESIKEETDAMKLLNAAMNAENEQAERNYKAYTASLSGMDAVAKAAQAAARDKNTASEQAVADYDAQIAKLLELERAALQVSTTEAGISVAQTEAMNARADAEQAMNQRLSQIREEGALAALALQNETAKKQAAIMEKGQKDAEEIARASAAAMADAGLSLIESVGSVADMIGEAESKAAKAAFSEVESLQSLIEGLSDTTVDAAALSGKALVKAYKSGEVAASDLSDAQRAQLEKTLAAQEKAAKKEAKIHKDAALEAWQVNQAVAIASATIQGIQAVVNALATVPYPAAPIVALAAGAAAGVQIAEIASAEPPSFRAGGIITDASTSRGNLLPDARLIAAELGEGVVTRRGVDAAGGEEGVRRLNAGIPPSPTVVNLKLRHETIDRVVGELAGRPSNVRTMLSRNSTRSNPYLVRQ